MRLNLISVLAIALIAIGIISLVSQGITYTTHKKVIDVGPLEATVEEKKSIPLPPILGGLSLVAGVLLLVVRPRRS